MKRTSGFKTGFTARIGILGAGIMGCCLALELARRGCRVDLIDRADAPMTGASLHNEGKLHLGFVYANDPLRRTHGLMLKGSLAFFRIIKRLTGCNAARLGLSRPFHYFVPVDSQLDLATIDEHFNDVDNMIHREARDSGNHYLGYRPERYFELCGLRRSQEFHKEEHSGHVLLYTSHVIMAGRKGAGQSRRRRHRGAGVYGH